MFKLALLLTISLVCASFEMKNFLSVSCLIYLCASIYRLKLFAFATGAKFNPFFIRLYSSILSSFLLRLNMLFRSLLFFCVLRPPRFPRVVFF
ncbi:hypothetical protein FKM82_023750 [Ascaphus truei]